MSGQTEGCSGVENVSHENAYVGVPEHGSLERKSDNKKTLFAVAIAEIAAGVALLTAQGVEPNHASSIAREVWDKTTNHNILAVGMASFESGSSLPSVQYDLGKGKAQRTVRNDPHGIIAEAMDESMVNVPAVQEKPAGQNSPSV